MVIGQSSLRASTRPSRAMSCKISSCGVWATVRRTPDNETAYSSMTPILPPPSRAENQISPVVGCHASETAEFPSLGKDRLPAGQIHDAHGIEPAPFLEERDPASVGRESEGVHPAFGRRRHEHLSDGKLEPAIANHRKTVPSRFPVCGDARAPDSASTSSRGAPPASEASAITGGFRSSMIASFPEPEIERITVSSGSGSAVDSVLSRRVEKSCAGRPCQAAVYRTVSPSGAKREV